MHRFQITSSKIFIAYTILYCLFGILYLLNSFVSTSVLGIFKVFPLAILILAIAGSCKNKTILKVAIGVFSGGVGDEVLEYGGHDWFALGAGFFLIGHIFYNVAIMQLWQLADLKVVIRRRIVMLLGFMFFFSASSINLVTTMNDKIKEDNEMLAFLLPIYLVFLSLDSVTAMLLLVGTQKPTKYMIVLLCGTFSFFVSDNVLGKTEFNDFVIGGSKKYNGLIIMLTYYIGQYCIVHGIKELSLSIENKNRASIQESMIEVNE